jgi:hypothetical protein
MIQIKLVRISMICSCAKLHLYTCNASWVVSVKQNINFNVQSSSSFVFWFLFCFLHNSGVTESCSSLEDLSAYKISWSHVESCKFCIHLTCLNVRHFRRSWSCEIKIHPSIILNSVASLPNFMHIYKLVQTLFGGYTQTYRQRKVIS